MSPTLDIQLLLQALDVDGGFLLDKVQEFDGVGHPEENVLQVRDQVCDCEAGQGSRFLTDETERARGKFQTLGKTKLVAVSVCTLGPWLRDLVPLSDDGDAG